MDFLRGVIEVGRRATVDLLHGEEIERDSPFSPEVPEELKGSLPDLFDRFPIVFPWEKPKAVDPAVNEVWVLDNTAFRSPSAGEPRPGLGKLASPKQTQPTLIGADGKVQSTPTESSGWEAEFVAACFIRKSGKDLSNAVASVARILNVDDSDIASRDRISKRLQPFVDSVSPNRLVRIALDGKEEQTLGPSNYSGICSELIELHFDPPKNPAEFASVAVKYPPQSGHVCTTVVAEEQGWAIISDIDDTIKVTQTSSPVGVLQETFLTADPEPIAGMPELYAHISQSLSTPPFFYLSASPYNLYPFLKRFRNDHFPQGTIILRDASWQNLGGLIASLQNGTKEYKVDRITKIHAWLPHRKFICIGDSTQQDPESYGESARSNPGWIKAIFIRKVTGIALMDEAQKNSDERFEKAFQGLDRKLWHVFTDPNELAERVDALAHSPDGLVGGP